MRVCLAAVSLAALPAALAEPLFDSESVLEAALEGPLEAVIEAGDERIEYPFVITVAGRSTPVDVRTRGNSRLRACRFPPLRLDFPKDATAGSVFEGQDKLKLVTHCSDKRKDAGNVFDEYLAYRLFNLVAPDSYRVRLFRIRYSDTSQPGAAPKLHDAFLIESDEQLGERRDIDILEAPGIYLSKLDERQAALVFVFQYLIGNTDWSLVTADTDDKCCHNVDLFERGERTVLVPYDFDLSGLVDASYAKPDPSLNLRSVRSRRYRGYCIPDAAVASALDAIVALESELLAVAAAAPAPDESARKDRLDYLAAFFEQAAGRESMLRDFSRRCL